MPRDLSSQTRNTRTVGRVSTIVLVAFFGVLIFLNAADLIGTLGFVGISIETTDEWPFLGQRLFEMFGFPVTPLVIMVGLVFFAATTGLQLACAAQAYASGTNPYFAGWGAWCVVIGAMARKVDLDAKWESAMQPYITSFRLVEKSAGWQGLAWVQLFFIPSLLFDMWTDHSYYADGPMRKLAWVFTVSTVLAEQMVFLTSVLRTIVEEAEEVYGNGPERPSFTPTANQRTAATGRADGPFGGPQR